MTNLAQPLSIPSDNSLLSLACFCTGLFFFSYHFLFCLLKSGCAVNVPVSVLSVILFKSQSLEQTWEKNTTSCLNSKWRSRNSLPRSSSGASPGGDSQFIRRKFIPLALFQEVFRIFQLHRCITWRRRPGKYKGAEGWTGSFHTCWKSFERVTVFHQQRLWVRVLVLFLVSRPSRVQAVVHRRRADVSLFVAGERIQWQHGRSDVKWKTKSRKARRVEEIQKQFEFITAWLSEKWQLQQLVLTSCKLLQIFSKHFVESQIRLVIVLKSKSLVE